MYFHQHQNNSGGFFITRPEAGVGKNIIVEAGNSSEATDKLFNIVGDDILNWCECCGERWRSFWAGDEDTTPQHYGEDVKFEGEGEPTGYVHYADGTFKPYWE